MRAPLLVVAIALALPGSVASAQNSPAFSPQLFHPAPGPDEFVTVESARPLSHLSVGAGLYLDYTHDPLSILTYSSRTGDPFGTTVHVQEYVLSSELWVGLGLWDRLQLALSLPLTLYQDGDSFDGDAPPPDGTHVRPPSGFALGDPRLYLKVRLYGKAAGLQLSVSHWLSVPIGNDGALGGAPHYGGFAGEPRLLAEWSAERWRVGLNLGFAWRAATTDYYTAGAGQALTYGLGFGYDVVKRRVRLLAELYGHHDFHVDYTAASPLELDVAARVQMRHGIAFTVGLGVGVIDGAGAPTPRVFVGVSYERPARDRDGDGIPDWLDRCPDAAEDKDGFQDDDGCPDLDNDGDGIPDRDDRCPNQAEDRDGFEDEDGCPDPDNDHDGVDDLHDACPGQAEDRKPPRPNDGCPASMNDEDGDGISDADDKCPTEAEDKDGFEDEDGCPDPDNDGDGIPDGFDECPNLAEDVNGVDDDDGCPEGGATHIKVKGDDLWMAKPILFDGNALGASETVARALLDEISRFLRARTDLKVRVEGFWDLRLGQRAITASQAQADAVRAYLIKSGVAAERLVAAGYGALGEAPARRVELHLWKQ